MRGFLQLTFVAGMLFALFSTPALAGTESQTRQFLFSTPGTYGWQPVEGGLSYDFFQDGRLHVQGDDGEATMWEGTWSLKGNVLTLKVPALKVNKSHQVSREGEFLLLDDVRYKRYSP